MLSLEILAESDFNSPYNFRLMKINVTEEDYVSGYKIKQQIKQKKKFQKYTSCCSGLYKLLLLSFNLLSNDFGETHSANFFVTRGLTVYMQFIFLYYTEKCISN